MEAAEQVRAVQELRVDADAERGVAVRAGGVPAERGAVMDNIRIDEAEMVSVRTGGSLMACDINSLQNQIKKLQERIDQLEARFLMELFL